MRARLWRVTIVLFAATTHGRSYAQSAASPSDDSDQAKKAKQADKAKQAEKPVRSFSDEDLGRSRGGSFSQLEGPAPVPSPSPAVRFGLQSGRRAQAEPPPSTEPADPDAAKKEYAALLKAKLAAAEAKLEAARAELKFAQEHWSFVFSHTSEETALHEGRNRLKAAEEELKRAEAVREDILSDARAAAIPQRWLW